MRSKAPIAMVFLVAITLLGATAAAGEDVDHAKLREAVHLPSVGTDGWYYVPEVDGRIHAGAAGLAIAPVADLRARADAAPDDVTAWMDLASAYRRDGHPRPARECVERAVTLSRAVAGEHPDDGAALAALGIALVAARADEADATIAAAQKAARNAWAGDAAAADALVLRAVGRTAGEHLATLEVLSMWLRENEGGAAGVAVADLQSAIDLYDEAVEGLESAGVSGAAAASVYARRSAVASLLAHVVGWEKNAAAAAGFTQRAQADRRRALETHRTSPYALTLITLDDAMSAEGPPGAPRHVLHYDVLPEKARAQVDADVAELEQLTNSDDGRIASRAAEGLACARWFIYRDRPETIKALRTAVAKDPRNAHAWSQLADLFVATPDPDELIMVAQEWVDGDDTPRSRLVLGKALARAGELAEAEKHWRIAYAAQPRAFATNLGLGVLVLKRAESDADIAEARRFVDAATSALLSEPDADQARRYIVWAFADAALRGLTDDVDGAERVARKLLAAYGVESVPSAQTILEALGRASVE